MDGRDHQARRPGLMLCGGGDGQLPCISICGSPGRRDRQVVNNGPPHGVKPTQAAGGVASDRIAGNVTFVPIRATGLKSDPADSGAVALIQCFGSAANLNIHLHCLVLDGVYRRGTDGAPVFVEAPAPIDAALQTLSHKTITRMMNLLTRRGGLKNLPAHPFSATAPIGQGCRVSHETA